MLQEAGEETVLVKDQIQTIFIHDIEHPGQRPQICRHRIATLSLPRNARDREHSRRRRDDRDRGEREPAKGKGGVVNDGSLAAKSFIPGGKAACTLAAITAALNTMIAFFTATVRRSVTKEGESPSRSHLGPPSNVLF